jgi:predicted RNA binding protein YcfA (HicA-like mRNA interferase family)
MSFKVYYGKELVRVLTLVGWRRVRLAHGHFVLEGPEGGRVTVPDTGKAPLPEAAAAAILVRAGMQP